MWSRWNRVRCVVKGQPKGLKTETLSPEGDREDQFHKLGQRGYTERRKKRSKRSLNSTGTAEPQPHAPQPAASSRQGSFGPQQSLQSLSSPSGPVSGSSSSPPHSQISFGYPHSLQSSQTSYTRRSSASAIYPTSPTSINGLSGESASYYQNSAHYPPGQPSNDRFVEAQQQACGGPLPPVTEQNQPLAHYPQRQLYSLQPYSDPSQGCAPQRPLPQQPLNQQQDLFSRQYWPPQPQPSTQQAFPVQLHSDPSQQPYPFPNQPALPHQRLPQQPPLSLDQQRSLPSQGPTWQHGDLDPPPRYPDPPFGYQDQPPEHHDPPFGYQNPPSRLQNPPLTPATFETNPQATVFYRLDNQSYVPFCMHGIPQNRE